MSLVISLSLLALVLGTRPKERIPKENDTQKAKTIFFSLFFFSSSSLSQPFFFFPPLSAQSPSAAPKPCGPGTERECCVNYGGVPDPYWDFVLLPVTLDNLIEKFRFTRDVFVWLSTNLPDFSRVEQHSAELHIGRMAEFNRLFLDECLETFCEQSTVIYSQLVFDNARVTSGLPYIEASGSLN